MPVERLEPSEYLVRNSIDVLGRPSLKSEKPLKEPKHSELMAAIDVLGEVLFQAAELLSKITGEQLPEEPIIGKGINTSCLKTVLEMAPDLIRKKGEKLEQIIAQINDALF